MNEIEQKLYAMLLAKLQNPATEISYDMDYDEGWLIDGIHCDFIEAEYTRDGKAYVVLGGFPGDCVTIGDPGEKLSKLMDARLKVDNSQRIVENATHILNIWSSKP